MQQRRLLVPRSRAPPSFVTAESPPPPRTSLQINDGGERGDTPGRRAHERMVRKLLSYPNHPAVMELIIYR